MQKNIILLYFIAALKNSWFWVGIWVLYYLRFTNYSGIGLLESVLIITVTLTEIPTGAIADLLGKKITLILAFALLTLCNIVMGFAQNIYFLILSVIIGGIGYSLYSGTADALAYDSLKQDGNEKKYSRVLSNILSLQLLMMAVTGIIGGFIYSIDPRFPYFACGLFYFLGMLFCFFLTEPKIDSDKISVNNFLAQSIKGFKQLFKNSETKNIVLLLLIVGSIIVISDEMLNGILAVEFGFNARQLGIFIPAILLIAAGFSQLSPVFINKINHIKGMILLGVLTAATYLITPWLGIIVGGITILLRAVFQSIYDNLTSVVINTITPSKDRATTISTFNMIRNVPYVLSAFFLGSLMDTLSAKKLSPYLGIIVLLLIGVQILRMKRSLKENRLF